MSRRLPADGGPTPTPAPPSATPPASPTPGPTGSPRGPATRPSSSAGCSTCEEFVNKDEAKLWSIVLALVGLWIPAAINLSGVKNMGAVQLWTSILKFVRWSSCPRSACSSSSTGNFHAVERQRRTNIAAIGGAMALCLFSYLGVETAAVAAAKVRNPDRTSPGPRSWHARHRRRLPAVADRRLRHRRQHASWPTPPRRSRPRSTRSSVGPGPAT